MLFFSREQQAVTVIQTVVDNDPYVTLVESDASFTRASIPGQNTLLSNVYIQPREGFDVSADSMTRRLTEEIQRELIGKILTSRR